MAGNAFDKTLADFRRWADTTERKLSGDPKADAAELGTLFGLMPDYLEKESPLRLTPGDLSQLLLDVYPRKVTVFDRRDTADTIPALRDLTYYLADTGAITAAAARSLERELDEIEPGFADHMMDPANWGPARAMVTAMHRDGVNMDDQAAVDQWIALQNAGLLDDQFGSDFDDEDDPLSWDGVDLKEAFGLPDILTPVRLPDEAALNALASAAPLLADLRGLARDVRETTVRAANVDPLLLALAVATDLVEQEGDAVVPGDDVEWLDDLTGDAGVAALEAWDYTFARVLDLTLEAIDPAEPQPGEGLDLAGHGIALALELFLGGRAGVPVVKLSASLKSAAVAELSPDAAERRWKEWTAAHDDPARLLLGQLAKLSAVTVTDEVACLEPLGLFAVAAKLRACEVAVPELPPPGEMAADDVVLLSMFGTEADFEADFASWLANRAPEDAARELLTLAASEPAAVRTATVEVVSRLEAAAEPAWWEALDRRELRCYAKTALLAQLSDRDPESAAPAELKLATEDLAWFVADTFAPLTSIDHGTRTFPFDLATISDTGQAVNHEALFEAMARLEHPDAEAVLAMLGRHADDKKTAKAARKAAFKAASRRASRRG
jgi:hypothetical protein